MEKDIPKLPEGGKETGRFAFGIRVFLYDNKVQIAVQARNEGIPLEIVLMKMRAWLRQQENAYFNSFDNTTVSASDEGSNP